MNPCWDCDMVHKMLIQGFIHKSLNYFARKIQKGKWSIVFDNMFIFFLVNGRHSTNFSFIWFCLYSLDCFKDQMQGVTHWISQLAKKYWMYRFRSSNLVIYAFSRISLILFFAIEKVVSVGSWSCFAFKTSNIAEVLREYTDWKYLLKSSTFSWTFEAVSSPNLSLSGMEMFE